MTKDFFRTTKQIVDTRHFHRDGREIPLAEYPPLHSVPNRSDLTCQDCQGHRIQQEQLTLKRHPRVGSNLIISRLVSYGFEHRAYCLDCGRSWVISRDENA